MKRKRVYVVAIICVAGILVSACGVKLPWGKEGDSFYTRENKTNADQVEVYSIDITIASDCDNNVYHASYPRSKDVTSATTHKIERVFFDEKRPRIISRDDFNIFYEYCTTMEEGRGIDKPFLYSISMSYYDESGEYQNKYFYDYGDSFPEEFKTLVGEFNRMCGEEVFETPDKPVKLTPEFIYEKFGVTADEYSPDEINAMLDRTRESFPYFMSNCNMSIEDHMATYYSYLEDDKIAHLKPTKILPSRDVTEEEWQDFARRFADKLGPQWKANTDGYVYGEEICITNTETNEKVGITRGNYVITHNEEFYGDYRVYYDVGCEGMTCACDFIYNKTGDYVLVDYQCCKNFADIVFAFYEME